MVILYSGEKLKNLIPANLPPGIHAQLYVPNTTPSSSEAGILLSDLDDLQNLTSLQQLSNVNLVLPIRPDHEAEDVQNMLNFFKEVPKQGSLVIANHQATNDQVRVSMLKSSERWKVIDDIGHYAKSKNCFEDFPELCMTAASELLTNAFYNGPKNQHGLFQQTDRTQEIEIEAPKQVQFSYGDDGTHLWMQITDPFGTFSRQALVQHLLKCVSKDSVDVNFGPGGAGIGLLMVFRWASQMLFVFEPSKETTVMVKFLKTRRRRVFESQRTIFEVIQR